LAPLSLLNLRSLHFLIGKSFNQVRFRPVSFLNLSLRLLTVPLPDLSRRSCFRDFEHCRCVAPARTHTTLIPFPTSLSRQSIPSLFPLFAAHGILIVYSVFPPSVYPPQSHLTSGCLSNHCCCSSPSLEPLRTSFLFFAGQSSPSQPIPSAHASLNR